MTNDQIADKVAWLTKVIESAQAELQEVRKNCPHGQVQTTRPAGVRWATCLVCGLQEPNLPGSVLYQDSKGERTLPPGGRPSR